MASCYGLPPFPAMNTAGAGQMQGKKKKKQITLYTVHFRGYYRSFDGGDCKLFPNLPSLDIDACCEPFLHA
jgi:hypothetical protein